MLKTNFFAMEHVVLLILQYVKGECPLPQVYMNIKMFGVSEAVETSIIFCKVEIFCS